MSEYGYNMKKIGDFYFLRRGAKVERSQNPNGVCRRTDRDCRGGRASGGAKRLSASGDRLDHFIYDGAGRAFHDAPEGTGRNNHVSAAGAAAVHHVAGGQFPEPAVRRFGRQVHELLRTARRHLEPILGQIQHHRHLSAGRGLGGSPALLHHRAVGFDRDDPVQDGDGDRLSDVHPLRQSLRGV